MSNLSSREQWKLNYLKHQEIEKAKKRAEIKKIELKTPKMVKKTPKMVMKTPKVISEKPKVLKKTPKVLKRQKNPKSVKKTFVIKKDPHEILTQYGLKVPRGNNFKNGWSNDPKAKAEYLIEWRKRNPDKVLEYRTAVKNDPVRYARVLEYDRNRPNLAERMLENKLRARERMKNPIYAKKEFYRNKLRRKYLTDDERIKFKTLYEQYNKEWKECNEKIRIARKIIENKA